MKLLELDNVSKSYGLLQALKSLTLSCETGSIGLLGPNGAGKSTLLKCMLGLLPFDGRSQVLGYDSRDQALDLRARVGYMPERDCYIPGMNAVEMCAYAGELCGLPRAASMQRSHAVLHYVGLEDKRYLRVETYSTGMKQRVKLAQALVHDPELLLLDEPTNGLDPQGREEMLALIKDLPAKRGCSILLSSHLLPDVEYICDRAILLHQGEMLYAGTIDELKGGDEEVFEVRVKEGEDRLSAALGERGCRVTRDGGALHVRLAGGADPDLIFQTAEASSVQIRHLTPMRLTLESAFVKTIEAQKTARTEASS
ncbi:MAG TPA: ABC transporter ATP-binding protein [Polyangia bacterium]|jgi:ABC-2 type transport system ATP-binding protein